MPSGAAQKGDDTKLLNHFSWCFPSPAIQRKVWPTILDILLCRVWLLRLCKDQSFFLHRDAGERFVTEQRDTLLQSCRHHQTSLACTVTYIRVSRTQWKVLAQSDKGEEAAQTTQKKEHLPYVNHVADFQN